VLTATPAFAATTRIVGFLSEEPPAAERFARLVVLRASDVPFAGSRSTTVVA
jgi:hypothetical protein